MSIYGLYQRVGRAGLTPEQSQELSEYLRARRAANLEKFRARDRVATLKRKDKKAEYDRQRYVATRQDTIARAVAWRQADKRRDFAYRSNQRAKRRGIGGRIDWRDVTFGDCAYCWTPCEGWDHVVPLSRGGANDLANIVPCCWTCNSDKKDRTPDEWVNGLPWRRKAA